MDIVPSNTHEGGPLSPRIDAHSNDDGVQLVQIEYGGRRTEFEERASQLFNIPKDYKVKLTIDVVYCGHDISIDLTDEEWPLIEDQFRVIQLIAKPRPQFVLTGTETVSVGTMTGKIIGISGLDFRAHTVRDIKSAVRAREGIPLDQQRLIFHGRLLEDYHTLEHYNITAGCLLHLVLRLRGGGSWISLLRISLLQKWKQTNGPLPRARRLNPSQFVRKNFICLHYQQRKVLTFWDADFMAFTENARRLLQVSPHHQIDFHVELSIFGDGKMEIDPRIWPRLEGLISNVWACDSPALPHSSQPTTSDIAIAEVELEHIPSTS